jgi:hypothetical protein
MDQHHHQQHDNDQQHRNHWNIDVNNEHSFNDIYYVGASEWTMRWETYWDLLHWLKKGTLAGGFELRWQLKIRRTIWSSH